MFSIFYGNLGNLIIDILIFFSFSKVKICVKDKLDYSVWILILRIL